MSGARRWWWVVVVPLVAALAAGALTLRSEGPWSAVASVEPVLTGTSTQQGGPGVDGDEYVAAFQAIATGTPVLEEVADEVGPSPEELAAGLSVTRQGDSTGLRVRFESDRREDVEPVLQAVTRLTLGRVFQPDVDAAADVVTRATADVEQAQTAVTEFGTRTGVADPPRAYQALLGQITTLDTRRAEAVTAGEEALAEQYATQAAAAREDLAEFAPLLSEYDALTAERTTARARLERARERQEAATERVAAADPARIVTVAAPRQDSDVLLVARAAGVAGAVALVLCLLLASVLQAGSRGRGRRHEAPDAVAGRDREPDHAPARDHPADRSPAGARPARAGG